VSVKGWPPAIKTEVTKFDRDIGDGEKVIKFIETFCRITKDSIGGNAGELIQLHPWQKQLTRDVFSRRVDLKYRHRQSYIGIARKNTKSTLISGYALYSLLFGAVGGEVIIAASTKEQARIVFGNIKRMVQLDKDLSREIDLFAEAMHVPSTDSVLRVVAADAPSLEGLNPSFVVLDEVHTYPNRELYDVLALASGARTEPMMVSITTAGKRTDASGDDSLAYRLYQYGEKVSTGEIKDSTFYCAWWEPRKKDVRSNDQIAWRQANPGLGDLIDPEEMESSHAKTPEAEFRTKRLNQWVDQSTAWLPEGKWEGLELSPRIASEEDRYVLGFDGSYSNDSTALVAVTIEAKPHISLVGIWERNDDRSWRVPIADVEKTIVDFCTSHVVMEIACDPYRWQRSMAYLIEEGLPVVEYPQSPNRMVPATQRLFEAVVNQSITQGGDPHLARHMSNAAVKIDSRGSRIVKSKFTRKVDAAIATVIAYDRAAWWNEQPKPKPRKVYGFSGY
jgi:phage terminase large subunit-like protein